MTELYVISSIIILPLILFGLYARTRVNRLYQKYSERPVKKGVTVSRLARAMLDSAGLNDIPVEEIGVTLEDHYDPRRKVVRLSRRVSRGASVAAIGIAGHEAAHAVQDGTGYPPVMLRNSIAPLVERMGHLVLPLLFIGILFGRLALSSVFIGVALVFFFAIVLFYLVTLPVELEASARAIRYIEDRDIADTEELRGVRKVLRAAALTYLVALALALVQFLNLFTLYRRK